ncbi:PucR family transcriptional regulator [Vallicoccus soli]|uniref:PucR family transcriptional regulator n=1 Tax=Vallicoccus soli TaxID=2339232 RepID=A0A3A3YXB4_9ACTN|nr:helix-turn-helix domain-containing protein [Vallicoccus soli]RJK95425.1 PucR family transcriptional regulator [Vallicoccus soli]
MEQDLQDVVDEVSALLGAPATLEDRAFHLVAFGSQPEHIDAVRQASILRRGSSEQVRRWFEGFGIATAAAPLRVPAHPELGVLARLCLPARWRGVTYGYLWLLDDGAPVAPAALEAAAGLAERTGALLARAARARAAVEGHVLALLGEDRDDAGAAAEALRDAGLLEPGPLVPVAVLGGPGVPPASLPRGVLAAAVPGGLALLVPARDAALPGRVAARVAVDGAVAGLGGPRTDPGALRGAWHEARTAARVARDEPAAGPVADWEALGAHRLLGAAPAGPLRAAVLDPAARRLLDDPDPRLAATARAWLDHGGSAQATAAALHVHRQTLYARLHRVEALTGLDLRDGRDRLRLHLALLLAPHL